MVPGAVEGQVSRWECYRQSCHHSRLLRTEHKLSPTRRCQDVHRRTRRGEVVVTIHDGHRGQIVTAAHFDLWRQSTDRFRELSHTSPMAILLLHGAAWEGYGCR